MTTTNAPAVQQSKQLSPVDGLRHTLTQMGPQFKMALPAHVSHEKFTRVVITAIQQNPDLVEADRTSFLAACMKAASDGLLPDGREGAIVVFFDKKANVKKAQWLTMIAGLMKKVRNSGEISTWSIEAVHQNDTFDFQLGDTPMILHKPALVNKGPAIAFYSVVTMKDGEKSREVMSKEDVDAIKARSRSKDYGPWVTDYSEMGKKTVARRHSKKLPMSTDLDEVLQKLDEDLDLEQPPRHVQEEPKVITPETTKESRLGSIVNAQAEPVPMKDVPNMAPAVTPSKELPI